MNEALPTLIALIIALVGGAGGFAALMKVNADNSKVVSEGATNVVKLMRDQIADLDTRLTSIEEYAEKMDDWSDGVSSLLNRAIEQMTDPPRESFRTEANLLAEGRPHRRRSTDK